MPHPQTEIEKDLLLRIAGGDEAAFATIFHKYRNKIYTVAHHLTESTFLAEEIVQDVFLKVWLKRGSLNTVSSFEDWLFVISRNEAYSCLRTLAREERKGEKLQTWIPGQRYSADENLESREYERLLELAVQALPPQQKQVYALSKEQGMGREEIASILKLSPETVKAHLALAMRFIRAYCISRLPLSVAILLTRHLF